VIPATAVIASTQAGLITISPYLAITTEHHSHRSVLRLQGELDSCNEARSMPTETNGPQAAEPMPAGGEGPLASDGREEKQ
jgi:hypothetical protein